MGENKAGNEAVIFTVNSGMEPGLSTEAMTRKITVMLLAILH
jgi:hypothetical protein